MEIIKRLFIKAIALLTGSLVVILFFIYLPCVLGTSNESSVNEGFHIFRYAAIIPMLLGAVLGGKCIFDFFIEGQGTPSPIDPPKKLVVSGFYRYNRNPMYSSVLLVLIGYSVWFLSLLVLLYTLAFFLVIHSFIVLFEEPALRKKFGDSYISYCQKVPRWIPRLSKSANRSN